MALYTPEQLRQELDSKGITVESYAKSKSLDARLVRDILNGRIRGRRGKAHNHAVAMGIKDGEVSDPARTPVSRNADRRDHERRAAA